MPYSKAVTGQVGGVPRWRQRRAMSYGLSNKRIAQELQIAPETVKTHVKGVFIKLAVQTRAHAVSTANALGLL